MRSVQASILFEFVFFIFVFGNNALYLNLAVGLNDYRQHLTWFKFVGMKTKPFYGDISSGGDCQGYLTY